MYSFTQRKPNRPPEITHIAGNKKVIIRCRDCWVNIGEQKAKDEMPICPKCKGTDTYQHAFVTSQKKDVQLDN